MTLTKDLLALYTDGLEIVVTFGPVCPFTENNPVLRGAWPVLYAPRTASDPTPWARITFDDGVMVDSGVRYSSREVHCPDAGGMVTQAHKKVAADVARLRSWGWDVSVMTSSYPSALRNHVYVQVSATRLWFEEHLLWSYTTSTSKDTGTKGTKFGGATVHYRSGKDVRVPNYRGLWFRALSEHGSATRYCGDFTTAGQHHRHNADQGNTRPSEPWLAGDRG